MIQPLILITNDDGLDSPGLAAAAAALDPLGELLIVAPRTQQTGMGRSRSQGHGLDGRITAGQIGLNGRVWPAYAANATPANCVLHGLLELAARPVNLVVSGINYGENIGSSVTMSGTIGAALEGGHMGVPSLAVSLELASTDDYYTHLEGIDFQTAAHFTHFFARRLLAEPLPADVDLLKVEVPVTATPDTAWVVTRQDRLNYYYPRPAVRSDLATEDGIFLPNVAKGRYTDNDTDAYALAYGLVAVTPLSIDLTSRTSMDNLAVLLYDEEDQWEEPPIDLST